GGQAAEPRSSRRQGNPGAEGIGRPLGTGDCGNARPEGEHRQGTATSGSQENARRLQAMATWTVRDALRQDKKVVRGWGRRSNARVGARASADLCGLSG